MTRTRSRGFRRTLSAIGLVVGVLLVIYPVVTDMAAAWKASQAITSMEGDMARTDDADRLEQLAQAQAFNSNIAGNVADISLDEIWPYEKQLTWQTPYIGWIEIPRINVSLPIYHDVTDESLSEGAGHVRGTSLPVGGLPSNTVISAHSGLQTARMFDDVRRLEEGDDLCVWTLSEPYAYKVVSTEVVEPHETEHLGIYEWGQDMLTLVTCTPLGVNSHRLLVHCARCEYDPANFEKVPAEAYLNSRTVPVMLVGAMLCVPSIVGALGAFWAVQRAKKRNKDSEGV